MTIKQLEKQFNVEIKEEESKKGFKARVNKNIENTINVNGHEIKSYSSKWLFTFDTFSKAQFIRRAQKELEGRI